MVTYGSYQLPLLLVGISMTFGDVPLKVFLLVKSSLDWLNITFLCTLMGLADLMPPLKKKNCKWTWTLRR